MGSPVKDRISGGSSWLVSMISRLRSCQGRWSASPTTGGRLSWWRTPPPCENAQGQEILNALKHVRPGNGFEFKGDIFDKVEANGENEHPLFKFLKRSLPAPADDTENLMSNPQFFIWKPVRRTDIAWNFEKFLIGPDGTPIKRYSRNFLTSKIAEDIEKLL